MAPEFTSWIKNDSLYAPLTQQGNICGVGANLSLVHDPPIYDAPVSGTTVTYINIVDSVERNTPAAKAGMQSGDIILEVDKTIFEYGREVYLPDDVADMIRGPEGSEVVIVVQREGQRIKFELIREPIDVTSAKAVPVTPEHKQKAPENNDLFLREECPPFPPASVLSKIGNWNIAGGSR
ncbi:hypothetical protein ACHAXR_010870 [Thalassiosira sp. AJA248-18]